MCEIAVVLSITVLSLYVQRCAYHSGVVDGYGYAKEPHHPGYAKAGAYLKKYMGHRWSELWK